jgi:hypothetical protein
MDGNKRVSPVKEGTIAKCVTAQQQECQLQIDANSSGDATNSINKDFSNSRDMCNSLDAGNTMTPAAAEGAQQQKEHMNDETAV